MPPREAPEIRLPLEEFVELLYNKLSSEQLQPLREELSDLRSNYEELNNNFRDFKYRCEVSQSCPPKGMSTEEVENTAFRNKALGASAVIGWVIGVGAGIAELYRAFHSGIPH